MMFADAHAHSNPVKGIGARAIAKKFKKAGGWFIALIMLPTWDYQIKLNSLDDYKKALEIHLRECASVSDEGLEVACFAGLHPAEIDHLITAGKNPKEVIELSKSIIEYLAKRFDEGLIDGVGEIGRPHYKTSPESILATQEVLEYTLHLSKDHGFPLQLHLENKRGFTAWNISSLVRKIGVPQDNVLVHHARPGVLEEVVETTLWATVPGIEKCLKRAFEKLDQEQFDHIMVESDFIDDPRRPGVVAYPWSLVEAERKMLKENVIDEEILKRVNVDNVKRFFKTRTP